MKSITTLGIAVLLLGTSGVSMAGHSHPSPPTIPPVVVTACDDIKQLDVLPICKKILTAPEIDPASAMAGMTMLLGGLAVLRGRRAKRERDA
jgi:hypothetical protein